MAQHEWWGLIALALGIAELLTGTFYLLVLAAGCLGGAAAAWAGAGMPAQLLVTALLTVLGWVLLHRWHPARPRATRATADRDVVLDIGERVEVVAWNADGTADVAYRGARWRAELDPEIRRLGASTTPGWHRIRAVSGNRLLLEPDTPAPSSSPSLESRS